MPRMVQCAKLGRELPGLEKPPFAGELGQRIYDNISQQAWDMWQEQSRLIINHYGLNLADPDSRQVLRDQMIEFLFGSQSRMPEGWVPEGQQPDKGGAPAGKGGGVPAGKGGGAPARSK